MRKMHKYLKLEPVMAYQVDKEETVHTLYGEAEASEGDYIIEGAFMRCILVRRKYLNGRTIK